MKARCRPFQAAWMEAQDEGRPTPAGWEMHLRECPDCRTWARYLEAERQAVDHWSPPPAPERVWMRVLLRPRTAFPYPWVWASAGLVVLGLSVGLWSAFYRPIPSTPGQEAVTAEEIDSTGVLSWGDPWAQTETDVEDSVASLLEQSGVWWTEDDLQALELAQALSLDAPPLGRLSHRRPGQLSLDVRKDRRPSAYSRYAV